MQTGPRENFPAQRARAAELACDGRHHPNRCVRTSHTTSRCGCGGRAGLSVFVRSIGPYFRAPLGASHSHGNHLLAKPALEFSCLRSLERQTKHIGHHDGDDNNANTGGIVGRDDGRGIAPLPRPRDDTAMRDPPIAALATTRHNTTREVKGGGDERAGRRADGDRAAGVRACARAVLVNTRGRCSRKKSIVCQRRCAASRCAAPGALVRPPGKKYLPAD